MYMLITVTSQACQLLTTMLHMFACFKGTLALKSQRVIPVLLQDVSQSQSSAQRRGLTSVSDVAQSESSAQRHGLTSVSDVSRSQSSAQRHELTSVSDIHSLRAVHRGMN